MRNDYWTAVLIGFLTGILALIPLIHIDFYHPLLFLVLPIGFPLAWIIGLRFSFFLERYIPAAHQFAKFVVVGFLNTAIDFCSLNLLSSITGITSGFLIGGVNLPGFIVGVVNSYFWNRRWVFNVRQGGFADGFAVFAAVAALGVFINSSMVIFLTTYVSSPIAISAALWLNIAKATATAVTLFWSFVGFKFFVFRK